MALVSSYSQHCHHVTNDVCGFKRVIFKFHHYKSIRSKTFSWSWKRTWAAILSEDKNWEFSGSSGFVTTGNSFSSWAPVDHTVYHEEWKREETGRRRKNYEGKRDTEKEIKKEQTERHVQWLEEIRVRTREVQSSNFEPGTRWLYWLIFHSFLPLIWSRYVKPDQERSNSHPSSSSFITTS